MRQSSKLLNSLIKKQQKQQFYSVNQSQNSSIGQTHIANRIKGFQDYYMIQQNAQIMSNWFKIQYQKYIPLSLSSSINNKIQLSQITKMKLQTKDSFDSMVHKLQDYYTFYYDVNQQIHSHLNQQLTSSYNKNANQNNKIQKQMQLSKNYSQQNQQQGEYHIMDNLSHWYQQINHQIICSLNKTDYTKSFDYEKSCKYMSLIIIPNCNLSSLRFIQWFNQIQVQSIFYSFHQIQYIQNSQRINQNLILQYPLVKAEQYGQDLVGKQTYTLVRQIQKVKFENQNQQSVMETCFQAINQDKCYQRLIRITEEPNQSTRVQIYTQSSQNIRKNNYVYDQSASLTNTKINKLNQNYQFQYFQNKWKKFQEKLNKDKVINKKKIQIYVH